MQFINPLFLIGLVSITIPVIIHLFNFRRYKRVFFPNVKFIDELKLKTQRQSKLKHLLILAMRILAVSCLVFAFAQPYIPLNNKSGQNQGQNAISIYTDNSFSMEAESRNGTLLEEAKLKAGEILDAYGSGDLFQVITNDFEGKHQRFISKEEIGEFISEITPGPASRLLSEVIKRQSDLFTNREKGNSIFLLSDFQKSITDIAKWPDDSALSYYLVPLKANTINNLFIDSCWFESPVHQPGQAVKLFIKIINAGDAPLEKVPVKLSINGNQKAVSSFDISARSEVLVVLAYSDAEAGIQYGTVEIMDNPIIYDDKFFIAYQVIASIPVLSINGTGTNIYLNSLLGKDSAFQFRNVSVGMTDYSVFPQYNLIILNELNEISSGLSTELGKFIRDGGSVLLIPSGKIDGTSYSDFLQSLNAGQYGLLNRTRQKAASLSLEHPLFNDVFDYIPQNMDLPIINAWYPLIHSSQSNTEVLIRLQDGGSFLCVQKIGKGSLYQIAVPLQDEYSGFPRHAIFVPTLYKIALLSQPQQDLFYILGKDESIEIRDIKTDDENVVKLKSTSNDFEIIPAQRRFGYGLTLLLQGQITEAGNYELLSKNDKLAGIAFNYNRTESDIQCYSADELQALINKEGLSNYTVIQATDKSMTGLIAEIYQGIKLWKIFVILALLFLACEVILLRFWK